MKKVYNNSNSILSFWMQDPKANLYNRIPNANDYRDIKRYIIDAD